jgi:hypothetical protein
MVKCSEAPPVELTQADLLKLKHCSPEELAEIGKCVETASVAADLLNHNPRSQDESVAQVFDKVSSNLPLQ